MRMLRIALVLLVLASFVVANVAISMAATATPKAPKAPNATMKKPTMPAVAKMPTKKPGKMIDLDQMKSNIGGVYQMLKSGVKMPGQNVDSTGASVKNKASKMMSDTYGRIAKGSGKSLELSGSGPQPISQLGSLPKIGNTMATMGKAPGENLMISLGL
jgi:hypothetical protein